MYLSNSYGKKQRKKVASGEYAGWLVSFQTRGIPTGIRNGDKWAGDNCCFLEMFTKELFVEWLEKMLPFQDNCLFIVAPDKLGDWEATLDRWMYWYAGISSMGYPVAFVGQDNLPIWRVPWREMDTYFVGGTDAWKDSAESLQIVWECRERGIPVHLGRGNTQPRLSAFFKAYKRPGDIGHLPNFTFDGNGMRYPGKELDGQFSWRGLRQ